MLDPRWWHFENILSQEIYIPVFMTDKDSWLYLRCKV